MMNIYKQIILILFVWIICGLSSYAVEENTQMMNLTEQQNAQWIEKASKVLKESGTLALPDNINYMSFITYDDFVQLLRRVTNSYDKRKFTPPDNINMKAPITRGAAIDLLVTVFGFSTQTDKLMINKSNFKDVLPSHPHFNAIVLAEQTKLISGYPNGTLHPDEYMTIAEGMSLLETIYKWKIIFSQGKPEWTKAQEERDVFWYKILDGFRLILTLLYGVLAVYCLITAVYQSRKDENPNMRAIIIAFLVVSLTLVFIWVNEILFNYGFIDRGIYQLFAILSILASLLLIKISVSLKKTVSPQERISIDVAYVDYIDPERGELFVIDSISKRKILTVITEETQIYNQEDKLLGLAYLNQIGLGDFVNIRGVSRMNGLVVESETILLIASRGNIGVLSEDPTLFLESKI